MQCYQCGEEVLGEAVYCHRCGARLDATGEPAADDEPNRREETPDDDAGERPSMADRFRDSTAQRNRDDGGTEQTLWEGGYSSKAMLGRWVLSLFITLGLIAGGIFIWQYYVWLGIAVGVVLLWAYQVLVFLGRRWSVHYRLTNQRFIHEVGILRRVTDRVELIDVNDITYEQGMVERLVGVGSVRMSSRDPTHPELILKGIEDVARVAGMIDEAFRAERRRRGLVLENLGK